MVAQAKPTIFLHENVPSFPIDVLAAIAGNLRVWVSSGVTLDPREMGFPVARRRQYAVCVLSSAARPHGCKATKDGPLF